MCVLTVIREESVPSKLNELLLEVLFLLINENTLSSPAFECGIVNTTLATLNRRSNSQVFVPGSSSNPTFCQHCKNYHQDHL